MPEQLQRLTERLATAHTQQQVLAAALVPAITALNAVAGAVLLLDSHTQYLSLAAMQGHDAQTVWQDGPLSPETPAGDVLESGQSLYFEHAGTLKTAYPHLEEHTGGVASVATAVLPLLLEGQALGVLILDFKEPHTFTLEERHFLTILATQTAIALNRAQLLAQHEIETERFRRIVEVSPIGMAVGSLDGRLTLVNDAYLHLLGYTRAEYEAGEIDWQMLTPEEYWAQDTQAFEAAFSQGVSTTYEKEMLTKTGERLPLELTLIRYDPEQVVGYLKDLRIEKAQAQLMADQAVTLQVEQEAAQAFMAFTESAGHLDDIDQLGRLAMNTLQAVLLGSSAVFYDYQPPSWQPRVWTDNIGSELLAVLRQGLPLETPIFAELLRTETPVFVDGWTEAAQGVAHTGQFQSVVVYPVMQQGQLRAALSVALQDQPRWSEAQRATVRSVGRSFALLYDRIATARQLQAQKEVAEQRSQVLEAFAALSAELNVQHHPYELIRQAQEIVLSLLPEGHAVYLEPLGGLWRLHAQTGEVGNPELQAAIDTGLPVGHTPTLDQVWQTGEPEYQNQYDLDRDLSPELTAHIESVAALPIFQGETLRGVMNFTLTEPHVWRVADQVVMETVQQSLSVALDRLHQQQVAQQEQAALQAFVRFTTTVASSTDLEVLARAAVNAMREVIDGAFGGFYLVQEDAAYPVFLSENLPASLAALRQGGVSLQLPAMVNALEHQGTVFADPALAQNYSQGHASALGLRVYSRNGRPYAMFATAAGRSGWTERERAIIESVGQGLGLALERLEAAEQVQQQRDEAASRARALEAFAFLSRDLAEETNRYALVKRAQEIMLSLLTSGYALYWEEGEDRWTLQSQVCDIGDPALQRLVDEQGLPLDTPALHSTWQTGVPNYQDHYDQGADTPAEIIRHVQAATAFRVEVQGQPVGMLAIGLFDQRFWTPMDKAVLETAVYSLGLLLERSQSVETLAVRTAQLELANHDLHAANEELEAFTYSASHDLRTPVRHVMGFAELAEKALEKTPNERAGQHLKVVKQAALRMTDLIDGMLVLSRSGRQELHVQPVDLNALATQARRDTAAEFGGHPVRWQISHLPTVRGDAQLLQQVMTNLFSNAVKYSAGREVSEIEVKCEEQESEWSLSVTDNGVGFDPNYAQKLFGIFQRLHSDKEFKGTGVGLATVKRIVLKHGGRVFAESDGRTGATFGFTLPRAFVIKTYEGGRA